jgi:hypothetical protein
MQIHFGLLLYRALTERMGEACTAPPIVCFTKVQIVFFNLYNVFPISMLIKFKIIENGVWNRFMFGLDWSYAIRNMKMYKSSI